MEPPRATAPAAFEPPNPVLVRLLRAGAVESVHRGAVALARADGSLVAQVGDVRRPVWARSSIKAVQALPLVETGAAERFGFGPRELALACASHSAEPVHLEVARGMLAALGLGEEALRCGVPAPGAAAARDARPARDGAGAPSALHDNCSGKHAGFLALALHLGVPTERYLDPESEGQRLVRRALGELAGLPPESIGVGTDGCSAPNFRLPLAALATVFARFATPDALPPARAAACRRLADAVAAHPELVAGSRRLCTDVVRATGGRLFAKIGAEGVYVIGARGAGLGLALAIDDGASRAVHALVPALLEHLALASADELAPLARWRDPVLQNRAGLTVGSVAVEVDGLGLAPASAAERPAPSRAEAP